MHGASSQSVPMEDLRKELDDLHGFMDQNPRWLTLTDTATCLCGKQLPTGARVLDLQNGVQLCQECGTKCKLCGKPTDRKDRFCTQCIPF